MPKVTLLNTTAAAQELGVSPYTLVNWRRPGRNLPGLPWVRLGGLVFYDPADLRRLKARRIVSPGRGVQVSSAYLPGEQADSAATETLAA